MLANKERLYGLDLFRIIAAFVVFMFHSYIGVGIKCSYGILNDFVSMGAVFMTGFFMLSGFSMYYVYNRIDLKNMDNIINFFKKRFISLLPLYYVFAIIYTILLGRETLVENVLLFPIELLGLQSVFSTIWDHSHNGGTWFISCLIICYFIYPYIQEIIKQTARRSRIVLFLLCVLILFWSPFIVYIFDTFFIYHNPFFRCLEFLLGVLLACEYGYLKEKNKKLFSWATIFIEFFVLVGAITLAIKLGISPGNYMLYNWIVIPCFSALLISLAGVKKNKWISSKTVRYMSSISYAFFLAQFFVWEIMRYLLPKYNITNNIFKIVIATVLVIIVASLMHLLIEKPCVRILENTYLKKSN